MAHAPGKDKNLKPEIPLKPPPPRSETMGLARKLEDLTAKFNRSEERASLLYKNHSLALQQIDQLSAELDQLRADSTTVQNERCQLREDHAKLQKEHRSLKMSWRSLQTSQGKNHQTLAELKLYLDTFQADHSKLLNEQGSLREGLQTLTRDVRSLQTQLQPCLTQFQELWKQQSDLQKETASLKEEVTSQSREVASIKHRSSLEAGSLQTLQPEAGSLQTLQPEAGSLQTLQPEAGSLQTLQPEAGSLQTLQPEAGSLQTLQPEAGSLQTHSRGTDAEASGLYTDDLTKIVDSETSMTDETKKDMRKLFQPDTGELASSGLRSPDTESGYGENDWPLFKASIPNKRRTKQDRAMTFEMVELNEGGHYDTETGVSTSPRAYC